VSKRRISQLVSLVLLHSSWGPEFKWFCNPVLPCPSCSLAWFACPIGVFVHYSGYGLFPFLAAGTVMLIGALVGRLMCGWVCPFGLLQDLLHKIRTPKVSLPAWATYPKYLVLIIMVFLAPFFLGEMTSWSFCKVCPASALEVTIPALLAGTKAPVSLAMAIKLTVLASVLVLAVFASRGFCRVLCPIGALLAPLNFVCLWAVAPPTESCTSCASCDRTCPTQCAPSRRIKDQIAPSRALDCIVCHDCQPSCPMREETRVS